MIFTLISSCGGVLISPVGPKSIAWSGVHPGTASGKEAISKAASAVPTIWHISAKPPSEPRGKTSGLASGETRWNGTSSLDGAKRNLIAPQTSHKYLELFPQVSIA